MKKLITVLLILLLSVGAEAQKHEIGVLGGIRSEGGWTGSVAYYHKIWKFQIGPVLEYTGINKQYTFVAFTTSSYTAIAPGVNANIIVPISKGYIYPGVTARYRIGNDGTYDHNGMEYGVQAGIVYKLVKFLALNVETGFRTNKINIIDGTSAKVGSTSSVSIPITAGIRLRF